MPKAREIAEKIRVAHLRRLTASRAVPDVEAIISAEVKPLLDKFESAAMTAHARGSAFCYGAFEECKNCADWRDELAKWRSQ